MPAPTLIASEREKELIQEAAKLKDKYTHIELD